MNYILFFFNRTGDKLKATSLYIKIMVNNFQKEYNRPLLEEAFSHRGATSNVQWDFFSLRKIHSVRKEPARELMKMFPAAAVRHSRDIYH